MSGIALSELASRLRPYWLSDTQRGSKAFNTPSILMVKKEGEDPATEVEVIEFIEGQHATIEVSSDAASHKASITISAARQPSIYSIGDGYNGQIASGTTMKLLYFTTTDAFTIDKVTMYCAEKDVTVNIYANNGTHPDITLYKDNDERWNVTIKNPQTGDVIETWQADPADGAVFQLAEPVSVPVVGTVFHCEVVAGENTVNSIGYGLSGLA